MISKKSLLSIAIASFLLTESNSLSAQTNYNGQVNTITTAVPFLRISPAARGGGMGDQGITLTPDANGAYWNVGKMAMVQNDFGGGLTYTPWLSELNIQDIFISNLAGYYKVNDLSTVGGNFRYFSLGSIPYTDDDGNPLNEGNPREFSIDGYYSRKFSETFGGGVTFRYIWSGLSQGVVSQSGTVYNPGTAISADFGFHYQSNTLDQNGLGNQVIAGLAVTNLGSKITYTNNESYFIPTNLGLGFGYTLQIDEFNKLSFNSEFNKLLVPTPQIEVDSAGNQKQVYPTDIGALEGVFKSFGDAPGHFSEEMREWTVAMGAEYWYQNQFALRAGYFYEDATKGARQYATLGLGVKFNVFGLNFSYIVPTNSSFGGRMPLSNTLRFSLLFDMNKGGTTTTTPTSTGTSPGSPPKKKTY